MSKTSVVWLMPKEQLQVLLDSSDSVVAVLKFLGLDPYCGNHKTLTRRVEAEGLSLDKLVANRRLAVSRRQSICQRLPDEEVFTTGRPYNRENLKKRILSQKLLLYVCAECGVGDFYNGKPLSLHLDHINGVSDDNRLVNLRFLCPNCHSQTETYGSKRLKKEKTKETEEQRLARAKATRKFDPSKEELAELVRTMPITKVARIYGVSDNAIRKRCKRLGIDW